MSKKIISPPLLPPLPQLGSSIPPLLLSRSKLPHPASLEIQTTRFHQAGVVAINGRPPLDWIPFMADLVLEPANWCLFQCMASLNALICSRLCSRCHLWRSLAAHRWLFRRMLLSNASMCFCLRLRLCHRSHYKAPMVVLMSQSPSVEVITLSLNASVSAHMSRKAPSSLCSSYFGDGWTSLPPLGTPVGAPYITGDIYSNIHRSLVYAALIGTTGHTTTDAC